MREDMQQLSLFRNMLACATAVPQHRGLIPAVAEPASGCADRLVNREACLP
jgi:hypothetical protein